MCAPARGESTRQGGKRRRALVCAVTTALVAFLGSTTWAGELLEPRGPQALSNVQELAVDSQTTGRVFAENEPKPHIIVFRELPLALYDGGLSAYAAVPRSGNGRLDFTSSEAQVYAQHLQSLQQTAVSSMEQALGRALPLQFSFQHALNGVVLGLTDDEAALIGQRQDVVLVESYREYETTTYRGPQFIGSDTIWDGTANPALGETRGEGMVLGSIDSGINYLSTSFRAVDQDGYAHVNPLGAGNYLGTCAPGGIDDVAGRCSDKIIGGYNFVYDVVCAPADPPTDPCRASGGTIREEPGMVDTNGHGTHTAATAAGSKNQVNFGGAIGTRVFHGVAPRANIVTYDACYTLRSTGQGLCPNVSTVASINQAVADGIIDVINYSIGGGSAPWNEATSLAFLAAYNAGIFVSASAGNSGPAAATVAHLEPWVHTVAASTHDGQISGYPQLTGVGDVMASFSSRGPNPYPVMKPEITAPGVFILAASVPASGVPSAGSFGFQSGTSMSAPHNAGAALLLRSLHPTWSPNQIKSALMGSALTSVLKEDGTTPSTPHDRGAGRVDLAASANAGLILDESGYRFEAANPATGGDPANLNLPSYYHPACVGTCTFTRSVRSATGTSGVWTISVSGLPVGSYTAPASILVGATGTVSFDLVVDATALTPNTFHFGELQLTSAAVGVPAFKMPIGLRAETPILALDVDSLEAELEMGESTTRTVRVSNDGNPTLTWNAEPASASAVFVSHAIHPDRTGIVSGFATTTPSNTGAYSTDDFSVPSDGSRISRIVTPGFTTGNASLTTLASAITWRVWRDDGSLPDGKPESSDVPVFQFTAGPAAAGVSVTDGVITLDVAVAGAPDVVLDAGRYWVMVSPHVVNISTRWNWFASGSQEEGAISQLITPGAAFGNLTANEYMPINSPSITGNAVYNTLAKEISLRVPCGAPWLSVDQSNGSLGLDGFVDLEVSIDATSLANGTYEAYFCVSSDGTSPNPADIVIPVSLEVTGKPPGPDIFSDGFEELL